MKCQNSKWILGAEGCKKGCSRRSIVQGSKTGNPGNFAMIAKISLGLRKFRNPSEIGKFR